MEEVMQHHPKNMRFTGQLKREDVIDYYRAADLFFLPSIQETFGIVIVEAAATGLPVLLRDIEQYRRTFAGGYEKGNDDTFARLIARFKDDHAYYQKWQEAAATIAQKYDAKTGAARLMEVYQDVLGAKSGAKQAKAEAN